MTAPALCRMKGALIPQSSREKWKPSYHGKPWTSKDVSKLDTLAKRGAGGGYS